MSSSSTTAAVADPSAAADSSSAAAGADSSSSSSSWATVLSETCKFENVFSCGDYLPLTELSESQETHHGKELNQGQEPDHDFLILFKNRKIDSNEVSSTSWNELKLVGQELSEDQIKPLLDACEPASFGMGGEKVIDTNYRNAFALETSNFMVNLNLSGIRILNQIRTLLAPKSGSIKAELYKLNVYGPGGFFRAHVDTPRGKGMFGSLVICLPSRFTGGILTVRNSAADKNTTNTTEMKKQKSEEIFDWGEMMKQNPQSIHWASFYSDCEHEISPVESGYRITLTYNLYTNGSKLSGRAVPQHSLVETMSFYKCLNEALKDPDFYPNGANLGFALQHAYPSSVEPNHLKGSDYIIQHTFQICNFKSDVVPVFHPKQKDWTSSAHCETCPLSMYGTAASKALPDEKLKECTCYIIGEWKTFDYLKDACYQGRAEQFLKQHIRQKRTVDEWIIPPNRFSIPAVCAAYGNEPSTTNFYAAAALIVKIPPIQEREKQT